MRRRILGLAATVLFAAGALPAAAVTTVVQPPVVASDNVELVTTLPDAGAISTAFSKTSPVMYVNTLNGVSIYDITAPASPKLLSVLPLPHFENERMTMGERVDGTKFLLIGLDLYSASAKDPLNPNLGGYEFVVIDVTDPRAPVERSRLQTSTSVHTIHCLGDACRNAYSAGAYDDGKFSIFDLSDLDNPREVKTTSSAAGSGHQWDYDDGGLLWHSGFGGIAAYDVNDPLNPVPVASTDTNGVEGNSKYNNFILHNSFHPFAQNFKQRNSKNGLTSGAPNLFSGNVLLATEEDYDSPVCGGDAGEGTFSTWHIPYLDEGQYAKDNPTATPGGGKIAPLDNWNTEILDSGVTTPVGAFCSAHYFTVNDSGFVAQAWYQQGTRILDVRDPYNIKQVGYFFTGAMETWIPYFVPEYGADGEQTGRWTDLVYTNDVVRGIDVLRVDLPRTDPKDTKGKRAPVLPQWTTPTATTLATLQSRKSANFGYVCPLLPGL
jgi:hypothetical protein